MKILVTGKGGIAGSWKIRGEQLGAAIAATVKPMATVEDCRAHDVIVVVKRVPDQLLENIRASKRPWVFDCVDFYPQPQVTKWPREGAVAWVRERMSYFHPDAVIWTNMNMMTDCTVGRRETVIRHHAKPGLLNNPIRPDVKLVNYEGAPEYLGEWAHWLERECARRQWAFSINAPIYTAADIVVALRGVDYAGYAQRNWKSNVKLANAHATGTPFVGQTESGYLESATGCEYWVDHHSQLQRTFDILAEQSTREQIHDRFIRSTYSLADAARDLRNFINAAV
jgi:hypothetical protein